MALLVILLKITEYHFFARHFSLEVYLGLVALLFTVLGIWLGWRLTNRPSPEVSPPPAAELPERLRQLGISSREWEVLQLIAEGLSNQEIARTLFISLNTVKTHTSNLFAKLDVQRRTQAVQRAHSLGLLKEQRPSVRG